MKENKPLQFPTVGVVGAGVMGIGLAQNLAQTGHQVLLNDRTQEDLDKALLSIRQNLRLHRFFTGEEPAYSTADALAKITSTVDLEDLAQADFVVENVTEKWAAKEQVHGRLNKICPKCVVGVNTSALSITRVGSLYDRPERIVGMHFMNPVPLKPVVEVIRGHHTSAQCLETTHNFLAEIGKEGIVVNDMPGFVSNRVLMLTVNEAIFLVQDQVAPAADIDRIFKTCFGHKMGPLETADLIGLDTILYSLEVLYESYCDSKYRPSPLLKKMVDAGLHGRKSGEGFYNY